MVGSFQSSERLQRSATARCEHADNPHRDDDGNHVPTALPRMCPLHPLPHHLSGVCRLLVLLHPEAEGEAGRLQRARGVVCAGWHHSEASGFRWGLWLSRGGLRRRADCGELAAWFARAGGQFPLGIAAWFAEASGLRTWLYAHFLQARLRKSD